MVTESKRRRIDAPFQPLANGLLEGHFEQLLKDTRFRDALGPLDEQKRLRLFDSWLTEINVDIIGPAWPAATRRTEGRAKSIPGVDSFVNFVIHLALMSQYRLARYMNLLGTIGRRWCRRHIRRSTSGCSAC